MGLLVLFLTPLGIFGLWQLFKIKTKVFFLNKDNLSFIQIYTLVPLFIIAIYSLNHPIKFNWIGPRLLALIPWIAIQIKGNEKLYKYWLTTVFILMVSYTCLVTMMISGSPKALYSKLFTKYIHWQNFAEQINGIGMLIEHGYSKPLIVPLDKYALSSELSFYQAKLLTQKKIKKKYEVIGSHIFGFNSLMYRYWAISRNLSDKTLIIISKDPRYFEVQYKIIQKSPIFEIWSYSPGLGYPLSKYYYQVAEMRPKL